MVFISLSMKAEKVAAIVGQENPALSPPRTPELRHPARENSPFRHSNEVMTSCPSRRSPVTTGAGIFSFE